MFANDIGIDLGTATTLIYIAGKGIVLREPSIVAMDERNGQVLAVGDEAYTMLGKTASDIRVVRPLEDGVISDYSEEETMLRRVLIRRSTKKYFLCDSSKFGVKRTYVVCRNDEIDDVISDREE